MNNGEQGLCNSPLRHAVQIVEKQNIPNSIRIKKMEDEVALIASHVIRKDALRDIALNLCWRKEQVGHQCMDYHHSSI